MLLELDKDTLPIAIAALNDYVQKNRLNKEIVTAGSTNCCQLYEAYKDNELKATELLNQITLQHDK